MGIKFTGLLLFTDLYIYIKCSIKIIYAARVGRIHGSGTIYILLVLLKKGSIFYCKTGSIPCSKLS